MILRRALCVSQKHLTPCPSRESEKLETSLRSYFKSSVWSPSQGGITPAVLHSWLLFPAGRRGVQAGLSPAPGDTSSGSVGVGCMWSGGWHGHTSSTTCIPATTGLPSKLSAIISLSPHALYGKCLCIASLSQLSCQRDTPGDAPQSQADAAEVLWVISRSHLGKLAPEYYISIQVKEIIIENIFFSGHLRFDIILYSFILVVSIVITSILVCFFQWVHKWCSLAVEFKAKHLFSVMFVWAIVTSSLALQACPLLSCSTSNEFSSCCWSSENPRSSPKCCTPYPAFGSHRETRAAAVWHLWADVGWAVLNQAATPPRLCDTLQPSDCCVTQINTSNNVFDGKFLFMKEELQTDKWAKAVWWL